MVSNPAMSNFSDQDAAKIRAAVSIDTLAGRPQDMTRFNGIEVADVEIANTWSDNLRPQSKTTLSTTFIDRIANLTQAQVNEFLTLLRSDEPPVPKGSDSSFHNREFIRLLTGMTQHSATVTRDLTMAIANTNQAMAITTQALTNLITRVNEFTQAAPQEQRTALDHVRVDAALIGQFAPSSSPDLEAAWIFIEAFEFVAAKSSAEMVLAVIPQCFTDNHIARNWYRSLPPAQCTACTNDLTRLKAFLKADFFLPVQQMLLLAQKEEFHYSQKRSVLEYIYRKSFLLRMATDGKYFANHSIVHEVHLGIKEPTLKLMLDSVVTTADVSVEIYAAQAKIVYNSCKMQYEQIQTLVAQAAHQAPAKP